MTPAFQQAGMTEVVIFLRFNQDVFLVRVFTGKEEYNRLKKPGLKIIDSSIAHKEF